MGFQKLALKFLAVVILLTTIGLSPGLAQQNLGEESVIAKIQGLKLRVKDVEDKKINDLRKQLYTALTQKIKLRAIKELAKTDKSFQEDPKVEIDERQVKEFYKINKVASRGSYEEYAPRIRQYMEAQQKAAILNTQFQQAVIKGLVSPLLHEPKDLLLKIPIETAYLFGNNRSKVMVLEFSDYQCPFCSKVQSTLDKLKARYNGRVTFAYRHLPLPFHSEADEAAIAVECIRDQGKFEEYHRLLYQNQRKQQNEDLKKYAKSVGIKDQTQFEKCLESEKYRSRVQHDIEVASSFGMNGTPSFAVGVIDPDARIINGETLSGALPIDLFISKIEKYLKK
ncbi:MAG: thioredoxin domain-containing protein [Proteobacteria bacterium]|nr:thioredoxin domain-containing protein [Pseudomonadota bacterium]